MTADKGKKEAKKGKDSKAKKPAAAPAPTSSVTGASTRVLVLGISKIGWPDENPCGSIVAIDKLSRAKLNIQPGSVVRVKKVGGSETKFALAVHQFKEFVGEGKASINTKLKTELSLTAADRLEVSADGILESEADGFRTAMSDAMRALAQTHVQHLDESDSSDSDEDAA